MMLFRLFKRLAIVQVSETLKYLSEFNFCIVKKNFKNESKKRSYQILIVNEIKHQH